MKKVKKSKVKNVLQVVRGKKFNPKKCPYKQILEHKGLCQITLFDSKVSAKRLDLDDVSRYRIVQDNCSFYDPTSFECFDDSVGYFGESCFRYSHFTKEELIAKMKKYDESRVLYIGNIDFYPRHEEINKNTQELHTEGTW